MNKVVANADEAIRDVFDGATIMIGGFGLCGMPENLIRALTRKGTKSLHTISNKGNLEKALWKVEQRLAHIRENLATRQLAEEFEKAHQLRKIPERKK